MLFPPADRLTAPCAYVSMAALRHNVATLRSALSPQTRLCAILKADAYGHSAPAIARELAGSGARRQPLVDAVAVATFDEAESLGRMSVPVHILRPIETLSLGPERRRLEEAIRVGWVMSVNSASAARDLARVAQSMRVPALVQVAVDTGMARAGVPPEHFNDLLSTIASHQSLRLISLCTHFIASEEAGGSLTSEQFTLFRQLTDPFATANPTLLRHAANSGGIFFHPATHLDMVRPGKALYGIDPAGAPSPHRDLRPLLKWVAPLLMVRDLKQGQTVGYGATFTADRPMRIGLVPVGFADGYARCLSGKSAMLLAGRPAPVVGRISMDYTTIDLTSIPQAAVGDTVTIIDDNPHSPANLYSLARLADTIPSELLCGLGPRIPRIPTAPQVTIELLPPRQPRQRTPRVRVAG